VYVSLMRKSRFLRLAGSASCQRPPHTGFANRDFRLIIR